MPNQITEAAAAAGPHRAATGEEEQLETTLPPAVALRNAKFGAIH